MVGKQPARPGFLLLALLVVWGISILNLAYLWAILLSDQKEFHFQLLMIAVMVAVTIPFIIIIWRLRFNSLRFSRQAMITLVVLWELLLAGIIVYWSLTALGSHHMPLERASSVKANFNIAFLIHIGAGAVLLGLGCKRRTL